MAIANDPELHQLWDVLGEPGNYEFPETTEEHLDAIRRWRFWFLQLDNGRQLYLREKSRAALIELKRRIRVALGPSRFSDGGVESTVRAEIKRCFHGLRDSRVYSPASVHLGRIAEELARMSQPRLLIFPIHGLSLQEGLTEFGWGSWRVFRMSPEEAEECGRRADDDIRDELAKHYENRTCIQVIHTGDFDACKQAALATSHFVVDVLRLAVGCHLTHAGLTHHVGIELGEPWSRSIRGSR